MEVPRRGETNPYPFRSKRLYTSNGLWYFDTREGIQYGPYYNEDEAKVALAAFVAECLYKMDVESSDTVEGVEHMVGEFLQFLHLRSKEGISSALAWANNRLEELINMKSSISIIKEQILMLQYVLQND